MHAIKLGPRCTLVLGTTEIRDTLPALELEGVEIFRLHGLGDGRHLLVDFDIRDETGVVAKVVRNELVRGAERYRLLHQATQSALVDGKSLTLIAGASQTSPGVVRLVGNFWIDGSRLQITNSETRLNGILLDSHVSVGPFGTTPVEQAWGSGNWHGQLEQCGQVDQERARTALEAPLNLEE